MNLRGLSYVIQAAELGSFRKAAQRFSVQPSALSRLIRDLERELGVTLFHRTPNGVTLTRAGTVYVEQIKVGLVTLDQAANLATAAGMAETSLLRIGLYSSLATGFLQELLAEFTKQHSAVTLKLVEAECLELVNRVRRKELDVAFIAQENQFEDCVIEHLWTEQMVICVSARSPLARFDVVDILDVCRERFILRSTASGPQIAVALSKHFTRIGHPLELELQEIGREALMDLVRIGRGVTLAGDAICGAPFSGVIMIPVRDCKLNFHAVWVEGNRNPAFGHFMTLAHMMSQTRGPR